VFLKCRAVDAEGPLARLKNLLFNRETLLTIAQWITVRAQFGNLKNVRRVTIGFSFAQEYWWAVLLMGVAFVVFMGIFIKCCAVHTPSSNPNKMPALSITQTLRHPYSTLRRKRHHPNQQQPIPSAPYMAAPNPPGRPQHGHGEGRPQYNRPKGNGGARNITS
jgi:disintegrin and metalloproteinase domain-containing protein 10